MKNSTQVFYRATFSLLLAGVLSSCDSGDAEESAWLEQAKKSTMPENRRYALPLNNPDVVPADEAPHMRSDDLVVGIVVRGHARAYPWWVLSNYHVVNDTISINALSHMPVYIGLCEQCSGAAAFYPIVNELPTRPLVFQISGIRNGTFAISDVQTRSQWHPFSGQAVDGPLQGTKLTQIPSVLQRWDEWKARHPDTDVVFASERLRMREHGSAHGASMGHPFLTPVFEESADVSDSRLPLNELVFGVLFESPAPPLAIPLQLLEGKPFFQFTWEQTPVLAFRTGQYGVRVFNRQLADQVLEFELASESPFQIRDQYGGVWNDSGAAVEGGDGRNGAEQLHPLRGYLTEWYEWVSNFPNSELFSESSSLNED